MTIDQAIGILRDISSPAPQVNPVDSRVAIKLGIEAMKGIVSLRKGRGKALSELLPGETKD